MLIMRRDVHVHSLYIYNVILPRIFFSFTNFILFFFLASLSILISSMPAIIFSTICAHHPPSYVCIHGGGVYTRIA